MYLQCRQLRIPVTELRFPLFRHHRDLRTVLLLRPREMGRRRLRLRLRVTVRRRLLRPHRVLRVTV